MNGEVKRRDNEARGEIHVRVEDKRCKDVLYAL